MTVSVDWPTRIIFVPKADLTPLGGNRYEHDVEAFRREVMTLEDTEPAMPFPHVFNHNTTVTIGGINYIRSISIVNGYQVEYEDGMYAVNLVGANNNILDIAVVNSVSINPSNSAGAIVVATGSGLSTEQADSLTAIESIVNSIQSALSFLTKLFRNKRITDPGTGLQTIYDDDDTTKLVEGPVWEDAAGTTAYRGEGADRADRLEDVP